MWFSRKTLSLYSPQTHWCFIGILLTGLTTAAYGERYADTPVDIFYISHNNTRHMDNTSLENAAQALYSTESNSAQRQLNRQWLNRIEREDNGHEGSAAISRIAQGFFKGYWQSIKETHYHDNNLIPDSSGTWSPKGGSDYNVRLSGDKINLKWNYDF